jgi:quercetin dioxygenase-like cupin family protein
MGLSHAIGATVVGVMFSTAVFAQTAATRPAAPPGTAPKASNAAPLIDPARPIMQIEEVALKGTTNVFGDPSNAGAYIIRMKLAANQMGRPHFDDQDRFITVLEGTLWVGKGDVYTLDKLQPVREGGVLYLPASTHYFYTAGEMPVVLQINGVGPVKSTHTEVDKNGQSVAENGPYPNLNPPARRRGYVDPDTLTPEELEKMEREAAAAKAEAAKRAEAAKAGATQKPAAAAPSQKPAAPAPKP